MVKTLFLVVLVAASIGLSGCGKQEAIHPSEDEAVSAMKKTMEVADLTPEEMETQAVSESDEFATLEAELDATVILEEELD